MSKEDVPRTVVCPGCGRKRELSSRQARRASRCALCRFPPKYERPTEREYRFWLERFSDEEILVMAEEMCGQDGDLERVRQWRLDLCA